MLKFSLEMTLKMPFVVRGRISWAFSGGWVQGRIFEDIKTRFFAIIHIWVVITFMLYDLFGSDPPKGVTRPPFLFSEVYACNIENRDKVRKGKV